MMLLDNAVDVEFLLVPATVTTNTNSTSLDLKGVEGNVLLAISVAAGGTGTLAFTVKEDADNDGTFSAIDATALFVPNTGENDTFDSVTTAASTQVLALNKDLCMRYVRVELTAGTSHVVTIVAVKPKKYANWSQS